MAATALDAPASAIIPINPTTNLDFHPIHITGLSDHPGRQLVLRYRSTEFPPRTAVVLFAPGWTRRAGREGSPAVHIPGMNASPEWLALSHFRLCEIKYLQSMDSAENALSRVVKNLNSS